MRSEAGQTAAQDLLTLHPPGGTVVPVQELGHAQAGEDLLSGVGRTERSHPGLDVTLQQGGELGPVNIILTFGNPKARSMRSMCLFDISSPIVFPCMVALYRLVSEVEKMLAA